MAGYNVTVVQENEYTIVNSDSRVLEGTVKDKYFVRYDGKKAEIIGVLKEGFKRQYFRDENGNDFVTSEGNILKLLDAIERRDSYKLKEQDYIVLSNWE